MEAARDMGQHREDAAPFSSVSLYYLHADGPDLYLFDTVVASDGVPPAKVLRFDRLPREYSAALAQGNPQFVRTGTDGAERNHFLWPSIKSDGSKATLLDVTFEEAKPQGLCTDDLRPYWEYVAENFEPAWNSREASFRSANETTLREFLARTSNGIKENADLEPVLDAAMECIRGALTPYSIYIRIFDRATKRLVKRKGLGPYSDLAPAERRLEFDGIGSALATSTRRPIWESQASWEKIRPCVDPIHFAEKRDPSDVRGIVEQIVGYVTLPMQYSDRVLGTLNIQFDDDSLMSGAKRNFIEAVAAALAGAIAGLDWTQQRRAMFAFARRLDETMFRRSDRPEEVEPTILRDVAESVFELTSAEAVLYYRYDSSGKLLLVPNVGQCDLPSSIRAPAEMPAHLGAAGSAVGNREAGAIANTSDDIHRHQATLRRFSHDESQQNFFRWARCQAAAPVIMEESLRGVFLAVSSIPGWLTGQDLEVLRQLAFKTGMFLEAKQLTSRVKWELKARIAMNSIVTAMAGASDETALYRLFLLAVTAGECLGFTRAVLFLRRDASEPKLKATLAVGATTRDASLERWQEAGRITLADKIKRCTTGPILAQPLDLQDVVLGQVLDVSTNPAIAASFSAGTVRVRRHAEPHLIGDPLLRKLLMPTGDNDVEYVVVPLIVHGSVVGMVWADRGFLVPSEISEEAVHLLDMLAGEFGLMVGSLRQRRKDEEARIAKTIAYGVAYSLKTRAAALEGQLSNLRFALGERHRDAVRGMEDAVEFLKRAGILGGAYLRVLDEGVPEGDRFDVGALLGETIAVLRDPRIVFLAPETSVCVKAQLERIQDVFLEILLNARDFTDEHDGRTEVKLAREGAMARIDFIDNGPGVHPELRPRLFELFQCYPPSRTGLGLSYALNVIKAYGGTIDEIGAWQHGAHFVVRIPLIEGT
jgi:signal transduction histidine kinase